MQRNKAPNPEGAHDVPARHQAALAALEQGELSSLIEWDAVSGSWQRSAGTHRIDPESRESPRVLTRSSLLDFIEPVEHVVLAAQTELDRLHKTVGEAGYVTLLCDPNGVAIEHRGDAQRSSEFRHRGSWLGGMWGEEIEGTNGIGTSIAERRPVTVHQGQHFRRRHIGMSCSGAPVFDCCITSPSYAWQRTGCPALRR